MGLARVRSRVAPGVPGRGVAPDAVRAVDGHAHPLRSSAAGLRVNDYVLFNAFVPGSDDLTRVTVGPPEPGSNGAAASHAAAAPAPTGGHEGTRVRIRGGRGTAAATMGR
jgi:hypothetical protein